MTTCNDMMDFELLLKYFGGKAGPEEAARVEDWAAASEGNAAYFRELHGSWLAAGTESYQAPDLQQEWEALQKRLPAPAAPVQSPLRPLQRWLTRVAALLVVTASAFAGYYIFNRDNRNEPSLTLEAKEKDASVRLVDGTLATVRSGGELIYPERFTRGTREVTLVGNGGFEVAHNPEQPFIVHLGEVHIRVIGTIFHVSRPRGEVRVEVSSGKVAFYNHKDTIYVTAGQAGRYRRSDKVFLLESIKPQTGSFQFDNIPLGEAAAALSRHFGVQVVLEDEPARAARISATFARQPLQEIMDHICATFNLSCTFEGQKIHVRSQAGDE